MAYLVLVKRVVGKLKGWSISQIPRKKNSEADRMAKLASSPEEDLGGIRVEYLSKPNITAQPGVDMDEVILGPN